MAWDVKQSSSMAGAASDHTKSAHSLSAGKVWKTPRVIIGTIDETETQNGTGADGNVNAGTNLS